MVATSAGVSTKQSKYSSISTETSTGRPTKTLVYAHAMWVLAGGSVVLRGVSAVAHALLHHWNANLVVCFGQDGSKLT
jgi:hypothetical protein